MKKTLLLLGLASLVLTACGKSDSKKQEANETKESSVPTTLPILEEKTNPDQDILSHLMSVERLLVNPTPPEDETPKGHKIFAANNWVAEKDETGAIIEHYRWYDVPENWTLDTENTSDETLSAVYNVKVGEANFIVQLYLLNAFAKSPLEEGGIMTEEELSARMVESNHHFTEQLTITIEGQEWRVGREFLTDRKMGRITLYRMENTSSYDDSVVVGTLYYPLDATADSKREALRQTIGYLKDVVYQIAKK